VAGGGSTRSGGVSLEPEDGSGPTYGERDHEFLIGPARRRQVISGEVETMQLWLDGSQCKWLLNLKRKAWALKYVAFTHNVMEQLLLNTFAMACCGSRTPATTSRRTLTSASCSP
jgi:hypothetical protein